MADFPGTTGDDIITGTAGADTISDGGGGNDQIDGGDGDDVISVSPSNHVIDGGAGTDRLVITWNSASIANLSSLLDGTGSISGLTPNGQGGQVQRSTNWSGIENISYIGSGTGNHVLSLARGDNIVSFADRSDGLTLRDGTISADGGANNDRITFITQGAVNFNLATGAIVSATLNGTAINFESATGTTFNDVLIGATGTIELNGSAGNDVLDTGGRIGAISLFGGAGDDVFVVREGAVATIASGGRGNFGAGIDRVETDIATFTLTAEIEDLEYFGTAAFTGTGNSVANNIVGGAEGDTLSGLEGDDTLAGEDGSDTLNGGNGADRLFGGLGADIMNGEAGNDHIIVDDAGDVANGGDGIDTVEFNLPGTSYQIAADVEIVRNFNTVLNSQTDITLNALANTYGGSAARDVVLSGEGQDSVYGRGGGDILLGEGGNDFLFGEDGVDQLFGGLGVDRLYGGADGDTLSGDGGNDTLYAEAGNDLLTVGTGLDTMFGGLGADEFLINLGDSGSTRTTADRIGDFSQTQGDRIALQFETAFIGTDAFSGAAGQARYLQSGGNTFVEVDLDGNSVADLIVRIDGLVALTGSDFTAFFAGG